MDQSRTDAASAHVVAIILLIVLTLGIIMVFAPAISGMTDLAKKSAFIASESKAEEVLGNGGLPVQVLSVRFMDGDPFNLAGQKPPREGTPVALRLVGPDNQVIYPDASFVSGGLYGKTIYIYPNTSGLSESCDYLVSTTKPSGAMRAMVNGPWLVQLIDINANILVSSDSRAVITKGTSSLPVSGGSAGGKIYRADCSVMNYTLVNSPATGFTGAPMNMTYRSFNGINQYMTLPDDPSLTYTGDMSISLWMRPATTNGLHQIIGKGKQLDSSNEDKNYDLYTIDGGKVYFEWDDAVANTHYHIESNSDPVTANQWNYLTLTVSGTPRRIGLYLNGVPQSISYYQSNMPGVNLMSSPPPVNLKNDQYNLNIGKQSSDVFPFYFQGDIGSFALYNRGLTPGEIQSNYQNYKT
jgi:hypothetical protein